MPGISYRQEYYKDEAEDVGMGLRLNARVSVVYALEPDMRKCSEVLSIR
jgi:hypothetical protein